MSRSIVNAERHEIPGVAIAIAGFSEVARQAAEAAGLPNLAVAEYPAAIGIQEPAEVGQTVRDTLIEQIIAGPTKTEKGAEAPKSSLRWQPGAIAFAGDLDQVNEHFQARAWSDGLPIVPPTEERVAEFLAFSDRDPDEIVALLPQANLAAVPRNIAANGVTAGCRPEHMPILIAAVEAIGDEHYNLNNIGTTGTLVPFLLINGPIIGDLDIQCRGQLISRGPNPALGRALNLIMRNIAGYRPGETYLGTFGYQAPYVLAENEAASPWPPFHVERGFDESTSTVTAGGSVLFGYPPSPHSQPDKPNAQIILELLCRETYKKTILHLMPERGPDAFRNMITLLLTPPIAQCLAQAGYTKQDIREYLYENARVSRRELEWHTKYTFAQPMTLDEKVERGLLPSEYRDADDGDMLRLLPSPDVVHPVVCGEPGRNRLMLVQGIYVLPTTKAVALPLDWAEKCMRR